MSKSRLDLLLVARGLFESREKAQRAIMAGLVRVGEERVDKPGTKVAEDAAITVAPGERYVGRGGLKLEAALREFGVDPAGATCLDIGASTGGFTDCLLQHGAAKVHAIDVGHSQLDWKIRSDPRVVVRDPALHGVAVEKIRAFVSDTLGQRWEGLIESPILGGEGNKEFLACLRAASV